MVLSGLGGFVSIHETSFYTLNIFGIGSSELLWKIFIFDLVCFRQVWKHFWLLWHFHCNVVEQSWQFLATSSIYSSIWIVTEVTLYFFFSILELSFSVVFERSLFVFMSPWDGSIGTIIVSVSLQLWRQTNATKRALDKMPCDNKENCQSWRQIIIFGGGAYCGSS